MTVDSSSLPCLVAAPKAPPDTVLAMLHHLPECGEVLVAPALGAVEGFFSHRVLATCVLVEVSC